MDGKDQERKGVAGLQWKLTERFSGLVPVDMALDVAERPRDRSVLYLSALVSDESMRALIMNRIFSLGRLYNGELETTRDRLEELLKDLDHWREDA